MNGQGEKINILKTNIFCKMINVKINNLKEKISRVTQYLKDSRSVSSKSKIKYLLMIFLVEVNMHL